MNKKLKITSEKYPHLQKLIDEDINVEYSNKIKDLSCELINVMSKLDGNVLRLDLIFKIDNQTFSLSITNF